MYMNIYFFYYIIGTESLNILNTDGKLHVTDYYLLQIILQLYTYRINIFAVLITLHPL